MKKKSPVLLWLLAGILTLIAGCGSNKNLNPYSELIFNGASPPSLNVGVNPPLTHVTYLIFTIKLSDSSLSLVPADAWTIDSYDLSYEILSDPGQHLVAAPAEVHKNTNTAVKPGAGARISVTVVSDSYLQDNASGFIGTADTARLKMHILVHAHRNKDGSPTVLTGRMVFTIGNF